MHPDVREKLLAWMGGLTDASAEALKQALRDAGHTREAENSPLHVALSDFLDGQGNVRELITEAHRLFQREKI